MKLQTTHLLLACLLLFGCGSGSNGGTKQDTPDARQYPEVSFPPVEAAAADLPGPATAVDADSVPTSTCDETVMGEHHCIINPGTNVGGGTVVARIQPTMVPAVCRQ